MRVKAYWDMGLKVWIIKWPDGQDFRKKLCLADVKFEINRDWQKAGRGEESRTIHAWAEGELMNFTPDGDWKPVRYNPSKDKDFTCEGKPLWEAEYIKLLPGGQAQVIGGK